MIKAPDIVCTRVRQVASFPLRRLVTSTHFNRRVGILARQDRLVPGPVRRAVVWADGALGLPTQEEQEEEERRDEIAMRIGTIHVLLLLLLEIGVEEPEEPELSVDIFNH